jgi:hypothetical protein
MARSRKWNGASDRIKSAQNTSEDGLEDLPPPSRLPEERKIAGTRIEAIERGRLVGEDESYRRREKDSESSRVARALAYSAWEFDGKPVGRWEDYKEEFGIVGDKVTDSFDRS